VKLKDVAEGTSSADSEISGLTWYLYPAVKGTLTIVLDELPRDQALDIACRTNSLDKQL